MVDLNDQIDDTIAMLKRLIGEETELVWLPQKELWPVLMDPSQLNQLLANLCVNARDAMPKGGTLTLVTRNTRHQEVLVLVADTGMGIPKENFSQIFEPFYTSKVGGMGAGLGLSVVHSIIGDHRGVIKVHSVVGCGSCFAIRLPAYKEGENHVAP